MPELASLHVINFDNFQQRTEHGLLIPMNEGNGLQVVDCGDFRNPTQAADARRLEQYGHEITPARFFGAASGLGLNALISLSAQTEESRIAGFVNDYSPDAFVDFTADLSDRAYKQEQSLEITQHSAASNEGHDTDIAHEHQDEESPLGCKLAALMGAVLYKSTQSPALAEAEAINEQMGISLPLREAQEGARILSKYVPETFSIPRKALRRVINEPSKRTPFVVLEDAEVPGEELAVVYDLADYRSSARAHNQAGTRRYHHTPNLARELLPKLLPEYNFDEELLAASGLLLGVATRLALSGPDPSSLKAEIIPPEYAAA